jgi:hypothetical protein
MANIAQTIVVVGKSTNSVTTPTTTAPSVAPTRGIRSSRAMISPRIDRDIDDGVVPPIRTNWASQAALSPKTTRRESVLVVQAVAGSSPVAYSPKNPAHAGVSSLGRVEWLSCGHQAGINLSAAKGPSTRRRAGAAPHPVGPLMRPSTRPWRRAARRFIATAPAIVSPPRAGMSRRNRLGATSTLVRSASGPAPA